MIKLERYLGTAFQLKFLFNILQNESTRIGYNDNACMQSLIQRGLNTTHQQRPTMSQVIESLKGMKI